MPPWACFPLWGREGVTLATSTQCLQMFSTETKFAFSSKTPGISEENVESLASIMILPGSPCPFDCVRRHLLPKPRDHDAAFRLFSSFLPGRKTICILLYVNT